ncbi:retinoblastoma-like protein 2 isoform X2 [Cottoperca gobio]|uniref:Retinoblastoma-like protein 2 isoform X2 n=1 Tax=Cottoperca gobio TaxID=56716 RepID=A0A6J2RP46_COTGO|nr:retinoblastoma-like protein 2 isoform X2 [Cottoperca gobio]
MMGRSNGTQSRPNSILIRSSTAGNNCLLTYNLAVTCCREAEIWYYRILEALVIQERRRLGVSDIPVAFKTDLFHSCLVACCLEITISSNRLPYEFPLLPQVLTLDPYHFMMVIESVLRVDVCLPLAVVRHLAQVEEKVLESLAWTTDSPLWKEITANQGHLPTCLQVMPPTLEGPTDSQPNRVDLSLGADQQRSLSAVNGPPRSKFLHLFARKVYTLMGKRLRELCSTLNISDELRLKIWTCFEYSLVHCADLMMNRHLDQLLMCAIYIIVKTTNGDILFKDIMNCYKSQIFASKNGVCKNVLIWGKDEDTSLTGNTNSEDHAGGYPTPNSPSSHYSEPPRKERGNIIEFYSQIYCTKMKDFTEQFTPTSGRDTPPLSPYPRLWIAPPRRQRLSSRHHVFITLYNTEATLPRTSGICYYFNASSRERLPQINNMIRMGRSPNRRPCVVSLNRAEEDEEEEGPSAKRFCRNGQSALQRRLRNVVNDRVARRDQPTSSSSNMSIT